LLARLVPFCLGIDRSSPVAVGVHFSVGVYDRCLLLGVAEPDGNVPWLFALPALWVAAWPLCKYSSGARRRYLVHLLYHDLIVHVVVRLDILQ
jgi:hypothetical protein